MTLPDPKRYISRVHAHIRCRQGVYSLKVISKVNPVLVNGVPVAHNEAVEIKDGDAISLGDYELSASLAEDTLFAGAGFAPADPFAFLDVPGETTTKPGEETLKDPFFRDQGLDDAAGGAVSGLGRMTPSGNQDLLSDIGRRRPADPLLNILQGKTTPVSTGSLTGGTVPPVAPMTPVDETTLDQFLSRDGLGNPSLQAGGLLGAMTAPPLGGLGEQGDHVHDINLPFQPPPVSPKRMVQTPATPAAGPEDDIFAEPMGASVPAATPSIAAKEAAPPPPAAATEDDIFAVLDGLVGQPDPSSRTPPAVANTVPAPAFEPASPKPIPSTLHANVPSETVARDDAAVRLLAKFCEGLGVAEMKLAPEDAEAFMAGAGRLLRVAIEGIYTLLILRAEVKKELRAEDRTMIASRENNPLKHSESVEEALRYLLEFKNPNPAFLPPIQALQDAFNDVRAHEMAVMAGMRAGLAGVIKRFDPQALEQRIKKGGALDAVLPALYKSKLWETYVDLYREIEQEVEDHFDQVFGREFVRAYMEQTKKLRRPSR